MKRSVVLSVSFILLIAFFAGCSISPTNSDKSAIEDLILTDATWFNADSHYGEETLPTTIMTQFDQIFLWYRTRDTSQSITREINVNISGDSAYVTVIGHIPGILHIYGNLNGDTVIVEKHFTDNWTRSAIFKKDTVSTYHRGWRLYAISGTEITTDSNDVQIDSVRITLQNTGLDTLITDVTNLVKREDIIKVKPGDHANITIYTNESDAFAFLHSHMWRWRFQKDSTIAGVYHGSWTTPHNPGIYRVGFDVLSNGTLTDDSIPYDANLWGFHYLVNP